MKRAEIIHWLKARTFLVVKNNFSNVIWENVTIRAYESKFSEHNKI